MRVHGVQCVRPSATLSHKGLQFLFSRTPAFFLGVRGVQNCPFVYTAYTSLFDRCTDNIFLKIAAPAQHKSTYTLYTTYTPINRG